METKYLRTYYSIIQGYKVDSRLRLDMFEANIVKTKRFDHTSSAFHQSIIGFFCMERHFEKKFF